MVHKQTTLVKPKKYRVNTLDAKIWAKFLKLNLNFCVDDLQIKYKVNLLLMYIIIACFTPCLKKEIYSCGQDWGHQCVTWFTLGCVGKTLHLL